MGGITRKVRRGRFGGVGRKKNSQENAGGDDLVPTEEMAHLFEGACDTFASRFLFMGRSPLRLKSGILRRIPGGLEEPAEEDDAPAQGRGLAGEQEKNGLGDIFRRQVIRQFAAANGVDQL